MLGCQSAAPGVIESVFMTYRVAPLASLCVLLVVGTSCYAVGTLRHFESKSTNGIERAAFELKCPKEQLTVIRLGQGQIGVEGCGITAVYVYAGSWALNSVNGQLQSAPAK